MSRMRMTLLLAVLKIVVKALAWVLERKSPPGKIRATIEQKGLRPSRIPVPVDPHSVRVAVIQEQICILSTSEAYLARMTAFVEKAADQGAQLVCFPEENGLLLLGQIPFARVLLRKVVGRGGEEKDLTTKNTKGAEEKEKAAVKQPAENLPGAEGLLVKELFSLLSPWIQASFEATFSGLARAYGVTIMAGSVMLVEDGRLYNRAYLFGPDGGLVGTQDKAHLVKLEMDLGLSTATELKVFDTTLGKLAFPVCMDATYFETFKILKQMGARMVLIPIANQEEYEPYLALRGIWPRVQESGIYGLRSALVGDLFGLRFTGKAGVFAPLALTPDKSGVLALAKSFNQDEVISACLDLTLLDDYSSDYFSDSNPALYAKYFPWIYTDREGDSQD